MIDLFKTTKVDPNNITNYNLTIPELQTHLLFWVFAAGHNAKSTAKGIDKFLNLVYDFDCHRTPFESILNNTLYSRGWDCITELLSKSGLGCWRLKSRTVKQLCESNLDLRTCSVEDLEKIIGIGPKTARCFILHTRKNERVAGLDTHILACLNDLGLSVPKHPGKKYKQIEAKFLELVDASKMSVAELDLMIWNAYSKKRKEEILTFLKSLKMKDSWYQT